MKPKVLEVEVSKSCNLKCATCPRNKNSDGHNFMTAENFKALLEAFPTVDTVYLVGGGEPFLNPYLFELLDLTRIKGIKVGIVTNGTLLTSEIINGLEKLDLWKIAISIDSFRQELLDILRPGASVAKLQEVIRMLSARHFRISVNTLRYKGNMNEWDVISDWSRSLGVNNYFITPLYTEDVEEDPLIGRSNSLPRILWAKRDRWCTFQPYITVEGDIYPCPFIPLLAKGNKIEEYFLRHKVETNPKLFNMGNILNGSVDWDKYRNFRHSFKSFPSSMSSVDFLKLKTDSLIKETAKDYCRSCCARWGISCEV